MRSKILTLKKAISERKKCIQYLTQGWDVKDYEIFKIPFITISGRDKSFRWRKAEETIFKMKILFLQVVLYCLLFTLLVALSFRGNAINIVYFYPKSVIDKVVELGYTDYKTVQKCAPL